MPQLLFQALPTAIAALLLRCPERGLLPIMPLLLLACADDSDTTDDEDGRNIGKDQGCADACGDGKNGLVIRVAQQLLAELQAARSRECGLKGAQPAVAIGVSTELKVDVRPQAAAEAVTAMLRVVQLRSQWKQVGADASDLLQKLSAAMRVLGASEEALRRLQQAETLL